MRPGQGAAPNRKTPADARVSKLGYLDSNQEQLNQNQPCCQLHHTPTAPTGVGPRGPAKPDRVATLPYGEGRAEPALVSRHVAPGVAPRPAEPTCLQRLAQALHARERRALAQDLHRLEERRAHPAPRDGGAQRSERRARLEAGAAL